MLIQMVHACPCVTKARPPIDKLELSVRRAVIKLTAPWIRSAANSEDILGRARKHCPRNARSRQALAQFRPGPHKASELHRQSTPENRRHEATIVFRGLSIAACSRSQLGRIRASRPGYVRRSRCSFRTRRDARSSASCPNRADLWRRQRTKSVKITG